MPPKEPTVSRQDIGEVEIPYLLYENPGPTIVMTHATGFQPWQWHPIARKLSDTYRIVAPYFCTHREPDQAQKSISWLKLSEDLALFCAHLNIGNPYLVGHSMGATLATIATAKFGIKTQKMVLVEPIFLPREFYNVRIGIEEHPLASKSIKRRNSWENQKDAETYLRSKKMFQQWDDEAIQLYIEHGMIQNADSCLQLSCPPENEAGLFVGGGEFDPWPILQDIACPVLVVEGETSENKSFIDLKKAAACFRNGKYRETKGAGHLIPMEKPKELYETIHSFLGSAEASSSGGTIQR
ncbi:MAG: alpha/beta hydrolase [Pseudomonadota bacterium]